MVPAPNPLYLVSKCLDAEDETSKGTHMIVTPAAT